MSGAYRTIVLFGLLGVTWLGLAWAAHTWLLGGATPRLLAIDVAGLLLFLALALAITRAQVRRERASAEAEARAALLDALMATTPDEVYLTDARGRITAASERFAERTGLPLDDLLGRPLAHVLPIEMATPLLESDRRVLQSRTAETDAALSLPGPDGTTRTWETSVAPLLGADGAVEGVARTSRDVTARVQTLAALQASEERFSGVFNALGDAVIVHDMQGHIIDVNDAACHRLGYTREELLGMSPSDLEADQPASRFARRVAQIEETGHALSQTEHHRRDGTTVPTELSSTLLHYDGRPAILSVARDVTERRVAEHRLMHLNTVLQGLRRINHLVTQSGSPEELLQGACDVLIETRGFRSAWIARLDQPSGAQVFGTLPASSLRALRARFEAQELPFCAQASLASGDLQVIHDAEVSCGGCPLAPAYGASDAMIAPLRHGEHVYGLLCVSLPAALSADPREISLFRDVCADIAFGLHAREEEERIESISRFPSENPNPVLRVAPDLTVVYANAAAAELLATLDAAAGRPVPADLRESVTAAMSSGVNQTMDLTAGERVFSFACTPVVENGYVNLYGRDVTERRLAQEAVRVSEERYRTLYAAMAEGVALHEIVFDERGEAIDYRLLDVNPAFERILGIPGDRARGALASEIYGTGEPPYLELYARVVHTGHPATFEAYLATTDQHFSVSVFRIAAGRFATVFSDISERVRLQSQVRPMPQPAGGVAPEADLVHDLNNVLQMVVGRASLLLMEGGLSDGQRAGLEEIIAICEQTVGVVREPPGDSDEDQGGGRAD